MKSSLLASAWLAAAGCAAVSPKQTFDEVDKLVTERGGAHVYWDQGTPADDQVRARVAALLAGTLTAETAVQVALLRNQGLVATYEELGIAQADLVQAGLLKNPTVAARLGFGSGGKVADALSVSEDFLELLALPLQQRVAEARLQAAKARVGNAVLELSAQVKTAVIALQALQGTVEVRKLVLQAQQLAAELRQRQHKAGNIGDLELLQEQSFYQQGKLEVARAELQAIEARERVNRLLGVWGPESATWKVADRLPELPEADPELSQLEALALERRLDLAAARGEAEALEGAASAAGLTRVAPALRAGVFTEKDAEGTRTFGPMLELELPLFDQGRATVARISAQVRQARARQADLAAAIRSEVRTLRSRLAGARAVAEQYRKTLLPLREQLVQQAQLRYNSMLLGVFQLLLARREQGDAYRDYLDSIRDYWTARHELERASGGALQAAAQEKKP